MVLLFEIPFDELKGIPLTLWSKPVDDFDHCGLVFNVIGSVKDFHEENVSFGFFLIFHFNLIFDLYDRRHWF